jgi:NAD(P)H-flavin reductase
MWIRVDGPYGNLNFNYRRFPAVILVSGGIGVTPVMGILKDIYRTGQVERKARRSAIEDVHFVWTVPSADQYGWFDEDVKELVGAAEGKVRGDFLG